MQPLLDIFPGGFEQRVDGLRPVAVDQHQPVECVARLGGNHDVEAPALLSGEPEALAGVLLTQRAAVVGVGVRYDRLLLREPVL